MNMMMSTSRMKLYWRPKLSIVEIVLMMSMTFSSVFFRSLRDLVRRIAVDLEDSVRWSRILRSFRVDRRTTIRRPAHTPSWRSSLGGITEVCYPSKDLKKLARVRILG
jgi:hypothetical protein